MPSPRSFRQHLFFIALLCIGVASAFSGSGNGGGCWFSKLGQTDSVRSGSTQRRQLLQNTCEAVELGGEAYSLSSCKDLTQDLGSDFKIQWTVVNGDNGNTTFRGVIDAAATSGTVDWAGFGFNQDLEMIGGNAFIVKTCSSCASGASIDDYYLSEEDASGVNSPSRLSVISMAAGLNAGRLQGVFEFSLDVAESALGSVGVIYAAGPVSSSGALQEHVYYSSQTLDLSPGLASSLGPAIAPAADGTAPASSATAPATPPAVAASAAGGSLASAPSPSGGCTLEFAGNNSRLAFSSCQSLATSADATSGFRLLWNLRPHPSGNGSIMAAALESGNPNFWAGYGIPSTPGQMVGANAIIVKPCSTCPTGASADSYALRSTDTSGVVAGAGALLVGDLQAARSSGGSIQALFTLFMPQTVEELNSQTNIIASVGPVGSGGSLQTHPLSYAYTGAVNLASGTLSGGTSTSTTDGKDMAHAILMIVGWGLLLPLGVVFARCKEWGPIWFQLHRLTQTLGYLAGTAGFGVGLALGRPTKSSLENNHRIIGFTVFGVLTLQVMSLFWRPAPLATKLRYTWNAWHWTMGGGAIFLAFANVFIGLHLTEQRKLWSGLYALGFGLILLLWAGKVFYNLAFLKRKGNSTHKGMAASGNSSSEDLQPGSSNSGESHKNKQQIV